MNTRVRRGGNRAREASSRDARVAIMVFMGYTYEGMAHELRVSQSDISNYIKVAANRARSFLDEASKWEKPGEYNPILNDDNDDNPDYHMDDVSDEELLGESTLQKFRDAANM